MLIGRVLLIGTGRVAVKSKNGFCGIGDFQSVVDNILYNIGAAEIARSAGANKDVNNISGFYCFLIAVVSNDFFNKRLFHIYVFFGSLLFK